MTDTTKMFFDAWGMADPNDRLTAVRAAVAADASYADPRTDAPLIGPDAMAEYIGMFAQSAPGAVAEVVSADARNDVTRATIAFKMPNGMEQAGQYFVEHRSDGLITRMVGFVGNGTAS